MGCGYFGLAANHSQNHQRQKHEIGTPGFGHQTRKEKRNMKTKKEKGHRTQKDECRRLPSLKNVRHDQTITKTTNQSRIYQNNDTRTLPSARTLMSLRSRAEVSCLSEPPLHKNGQGKQITDIPPRQSQPDIIHCS
ncbi:hypothetical protein MAP00_006874 [Monascus purpureus]|nr:hypothetical protein MAP00_006874 [Monascus purpureus]